VQSEIEAWHTQNPFGSGFIARPQRRKTLDVRAVCRSARQRGGADIPEDAMVHAVELYLKEKNYLLLLGHIISDGWCTVALFIRGVFDSVSAPFDHSKHTLVAEYQMGPKLIGLLKTLAVKFLGLAESGFFIAEVLDAFTNMRNTILSPLHNAWIRGGKVKVAGPHPDNGVYIVNMLTKVRIKLADSSLVQNKPSELLILLPALDPGTYQIEVTTQYTASSALLKEPRTTVFECVFTVV
jgi:hypothetical protein